MLSFDLAMYKIRLLKKASRNLEQLDKTVARRIVRKMNWLAENVETMTPKGLRKNLSAYAKLREGNYRVIYQVLPEEDNNHRSFYRSSKRNLQEQMNAAKEKCN